MTLGTKPRSRYTVYIMTAVDGATVYVGFTSDLPQRLRHHDATKPWYADVDTIRCEHFTDKATALSRESELISSLRPRYGTGGDAFGKPERGACRNWRWCGALATTTRDGYAVCDYHAAGGRIAEDRRRKEVAA